MQDIIKTNVIKTSRIASVSWHASGSEHYLLGLDISLPSMVNFNAGIQSYLCWRKGRYFIIKRQNFDLRTDVFSANVVALMQDSSH